MPRLVYLNGAPGTGKSTVAQILSRSVEMALAIDVDQLKHGLGDWERDPIASGLHARRLALALADEHLSAGYDVFLGQYAARTEFIEALEALARRRSASFHEFILDLDVDRLAQRLRARTDAPTRPEHTINGGLVGASDAPELVRSLASVRAARPHAVRIDAAGTIPDTVAGVEAALRG
jgi:predicted kinase